ncbi:MAG: glycoside hydrolase family 97 N-terminal domain-containing protein, partial [Prolixibacteraceae bacterium]|nr:glycoside hydrolase family 97 N-terminal domain-containing protein [Prolixibacteraceae bacterium]
MKNLTKIIILFSVLFFYLQAHSKEYRIDSPNGKISLYIYADDDISWSAYMSGKVILEKCPLSLSLSNGETLGENVRVAKSEQKSHSRQIKPEVPRKKSIISDVYNELSLKMRGNYKVVFRVYDHGVAYRFETAFK